MTVSTNANQTTVYGNGVTTTFTYPFIMASSSNAVVTYHDASGNSNVLTSSQYNLVLNPAAAGALWGVGGSVTYPITGSPIATGTNLNIARQVPYTQPTSLINQGAYYADVVESALDNLEFQIQQIYATVAGVVFGRWRGVWAPNTVYNAGDNIIDGAAGNNTQNIYTCLTNNTSSSSFAADLAAGDWQLSIQVQAVGGLAGGDLTGSYPAPTIAKIQGVTVTGVTGTGNAVLSQAPTINAPAITGNATAVNLNATGTLSLNSHGVITQKLVTRVTSSGTFTRQTNTVYMDIEMVGGGGGGGGVQGQTSGATTLGAGGGASGTYSKKTVSAATFGTSQTATIGAAGAAGAAGANNGGAGGQTSMGSLCTAPGGGGGGGAGTGSAGIAGTPGAAGTGDFSAPGMPGGVGYANNSGWGYGGQGGTPQLFGAGGLMPTAGSSGTYPGNAGTGNGGGGSGGYTVNTTSTVAGGAGSAGIILVTEYLSN